MVAADDLKPIHARYFMTNSEKKIKVVESNRLASGDVLITFSDDTVVLFHAQFLYDVRGHESNVQIVDPFKK
jgi:hypothetical protein